MGQVKLKRSKYKPVIDALDGLLRETNARYPVIVYRENYPNFTSATAHKLGQEFFPSHTIHTKLNWEDGVVASVSVWLTPKMQSTT